MRTPERISPEELQMTVSAFLQEKCFKDDPSGPWLCKKCGACIVSEEVFFSVHDSRFSICSGFGEVRKVPIPFCRVCETPPKKDSCVHLAAVRIVEGGVA